MLDDHFCTYQQSLELKDLGFFEDCLGSYWKNKDNEVKFFLDGDIIVEDEYQWVFEVFRPLKSQVFEFIRDKYKISHRIQETSYFGEVEYNYFLKKDGTELYDNILDEFDSWFIAEENCIDHMLTIIKDDNNNN
jgi:hypothetical protein